MVIASDAKGSVQVGKSISLVGCTCRSSGGASQPGRYEVCESCELKSHDHRDELPVTIFRVFYMK